MLTLDHNNMHLARKSCSIVSKPFKADRGTRVPPVKSLPNEDDIPAPIRSHLSSKVPSSHWRRFLRMLLVIQCLLTLLVDTAKDGCLSLASSIYTAKSLASYSRPFAQKMCWRSGECPRQVLWNFIAAARPPLKIALALVSSHFARRLGIHAASVCHPESFEPSARSMFMPDCQSLLLSMKRSRLARF